LAVLLMASEAALVTLPVTCEAVLLTLFQALLAHPPTELSNPEFSAGFGGSLVSRAGGGAGAAEAGALVGGGLPAPVTLFQVFPAQSLTLPRKPRSFSGCGAAGCLAGAAWGGLAG